MLPLFLWLSPVADGGPKGFGGFPFLVVWTQFFIFLVGSNRMKLIPRQHLLGR